MRLRAGAGALIAALAFGAFGCGGGAGENDKVKDTVKSYFNAIVDHDGKKICSLLSSQLVAVAGKTCAKSLGEQAARAVPKNKRKELKRLRVTDVKITKANNKTTATAKAVGPSGSRVYDLVKERGTWKLAVT